ncbi:MAG: hypothetical protein NTW86_25950, partial [Candidatus Sumerlaeota bacterium]|nr:hypothetical protein [Candidatus Sumerlaeota bacterium]
MESGSKMTPPPGREQKLFWREQSFYPPLELPTLPDDLLATLKPHPRLLVTDFKALSDKIAANPRMTRWYEKIKSQVEDLMAKGKLIADTPPGSRILTEANKGAIRIYNAALVYNIEKLRGNPDTPKYLDWATKELMNFADLPNWHVFDHFLDTSVLIHGVSVGYDWLYNALTPEQRASVARSIRTKGVAEAEKFYTGEKKSADFWPEKVSNVNQVDNCGVGIGALAIAETDREYSNRILHYAFQSLYNVMGAWQPDGGWYEGPGYIYFCSRYDCYFFASLESALGTDFGLSNAPGFGKSGDFVMYTAALSRKRDFRFATGSCVPGISGGEQMFYLGKKFNHPEYMWWEEPLADAAPLPWHLIWYEPGFAKSPKELGLPLDKYFRFVEVAAFHGSWEDESGACLATKGKIIPFYKHSDLD